MWFRNQLTTSKQLLARSTSVLLATLLWGLVVPSVQAADQFWVSLGSYSQLAGAETVRDSAASTFSQLSVIPADSPIGFVYRVVEGPSTDLSSAESMLERARIAGFVDAWILKQDSADNIYGDSYSSGSSSSSDLGGSSSYQLEDSASGAVLDNYSPANSPTSSIADPSSADYDSVSIGTQELVEDAPPGYGLHQLHRVGTLVRDGEVVESRLRALDPENAPDPETAVDPENAN